MSDPDRAERDQTAPLWPLVALCLAMLLPSMGNSIANVALPTLADLFAASFQEVQWVVLAYLLAITVLLVSVGRLGDLIGRRRLMLAGMVVFTLASLACGLSSTLAELVASRVFQGLGAAVMMTLSMAMVGETLSVDKTARALGLLGTMSAVGTAIGPSLGGFLISAFDWHAIFLVSVPLGVLAFLLAARFLPRDVRHAKTPQTARAFDIPGTLSLTALLLAYALAMTWGRGEYGWVNLMLLAAFALGLVVFIRIEKSASSPLIRLGILRNPAFSAALLSNAMCTTVTMTTFVVGPFFLARAFGLDAAMVGLVVSVGPATIAVTAAPAARLVDRFGVRVTSTVGIVGMIFGAALLCLGSARWGLVGYIVPLIILTGFYATFQTANNTRIMQTAEASQRGLISGMLNLSRYMGLITGTCVMGAVYSMGSQLGGMPSVEGAQTGLRITLGATLPLIALALGAPALMRALLSRQAATSNRG